MTPRNIAALVLTMISLACLYPGLTKPILQIHIGAKIPFLGKVDIFDQTQSILQSIESLHKSDNTLVAVLILLFSVIVPVAKALMLSLIIIFKNLKFGEAIHKFLGIIGKWSMADVFTVAILMAFLASQAHPKATSQLHEGFYYFLAYCVISILGIQVAKVEKPQD